MATYRKVEIVDAEKYEGAPLTVMHDHLGEQKALPGDWLLGTERGKIRVMSAKQFEAEFVPYTDEEPGKKHAAAAHKNEIGDLQAQIADMRVSKQNLEVALDDSMDKISALRKQIAALKKDSEENSTPLREHPVSTHKAVSKKK
jgi:septal ring factor EnvC (AmiA/AmiB activator)